MIKDHQNWSIYSRYPLFLFIFLSCLPYTILSQCPGTSCTYTITGTDSGSYTVNVGEKICLDPGANFTGTVDLNDGELINCATNPQIFSFTGLPTGTINNYGIIEYPLSHTFPNGLTFNNYLTLNTTNNLTVEVGAVFNNFGDANIGGTLLNRDQITNSGNITVVGQLSENTSAVLTNSGTITADGWTVNGTWTNSGTVDINGTFLMGTGKTGTLDGGCISSITFTNRGTITGTTCGDINVSGTSTLSSSGSLLGDIAIIDATPPGTAPFIDNVISGSTIDPTVVWTSCNPACGSSPVDEICNNSIDDNGDGRIDEPFPGGVQSNMQLWLKAETGTNTTVDGNDVTSWADQSINGYSADADVNSTDDPTYSDNELNFNPGIVFDGTYTDDFSDGLHLGSDYIYSTNNGIHIFAIVNTLSGGLQYDKVVEFGGTVTDGYGLGWSYNSTRSTTPSGAGGATSFLNHFTGAAPSLLEFEVKFNNEQTVYQDGNIVVTTPGITLSQLTAAEIAESDHYGTAANGDDTSGPFSIGRKSASQYLDQNRVFMGSISEVLVYNDTLTQVEKERIQSYLALKYGMTMSHDYAASSGTTLKDVTDGYANEIVGIGRDDCSGLNQKQSKSIEEEGVVTLSLGAIAANNQSNANTFSSDERFLIVGNDGQSVDTWTPVGGFSSDSRINRTWKINNTNVNQSITFTIDMDDPQNNIASLTAGALSGYKIMFDMDGDFSNGGSLTTSLTNTTGSLYEVTLNPGSWQYFTIVHEEGAPVVDEICNNLIDDNGDGRIDEVFPGGVQQDMQLWLKAETGTNTTVDGNDITSWADQSINGYSADADVNSTDDPIFSENAINFNPGVDFDGVYNDGFSDGLHLGSDYIYGEKDGLHVFVVCDPDVAASTDKYVFDFGLQSNGGYGMIYSDNDYGMYTNSLFGGTNTELFHSEGDEPALVEMKVDFDDAQEFYRNGDLLSSIPVTIAELSETEVNEAPGYGALGTTTGPVSIGRKSASVFLDQNGGRMFDGRISEVIVFTDTLSSLEKQQVNSYLAVKYGLTMTQDYVSSTGSIKKDVSDGYANHIAGIGRDDCSGLHQKQSKSIESEAIVTVGQGTIATTNELNGNSIPADGTYLMWGNDGAPANASWVDANVSIPGTDFASIDRTWKFTEHFDITNALFQVEVDNLNFDLPAMPGTADGTYYLLRDDDGDFTNGGTTYEPMSFVAGDTWETTLADPTNDEYFTIAVGTTCLAQAPALAK